MLYGNEEEKEILEYLKTSIEDSLILNDYEMVEINILNKVIFSKIDVSNITELLEEKEEKIADIESQLEDSSYLESQVEDLETEVNDLEHEIKTLKQSIYILEDTEIELNDKVIDLENIIKSKD